MYLNLELGKKVLYKLNVLLIEERMKVGSTQINKHRVLTSILREFLPSKVAFCFHIVTVRVPR